MTKKELIALMKTCRTRSDFFKKHIKAYKVVYLNYYDLLDQVLPLQSSNLDRMDKKNQKQFIENKMNFCVSIEVYRKIFFKAYIFTRDYWPELLLNKYNAKFVKNVRPRYSENEIIKLLSTKGLTRDKVFKKHSYYNDLIEFYPKILKTKFPTRISLKDIQDLSKKELIKILSSYGSKTNLIHKGSLYIRFCNRVYPNLIDEIFPIKHKRIYSIPLHQVKKKSLRT